MLGLLELLGSAAPGAAADRVIHYPRLAGAAEPLAAYIGDLMPLILARAGEQMSAAPTDEPVAKERALRELADDTGLFDFYWVMTNAERQKAMLPIRFPIDRGLIGWRMAFVNGDQPDRLAPIRTIEDLKSLAAGQMREWPDTRILEANGLSVTESITYDGLFRMLAEQRIDYFPRSAMEIAGELAAHAGQPLRIDRHLVLHYPAAIYLFVGRSNRRLADIFVRGLEAAQADGSLQHLFNQYFGANLEALELGERQVIELRNPLLPDDLPLDRPELWYRPG
jgi:hypothetical protein